MAQTTSTTSPASKQWGLKVGINFPKYKFKNNDTKNEQTNFATNFHVTGYLDLPLRGHYLRLQPALSLQGKGSEYINTGTLGNSMEIKENIIVLEIPVNIVGRIPVSKTGTYLFLGAGPYAGVSLLGERKTKNSTSTEETSKKLKFGDEDNIGSDSKRIDFGLNFSAGLQLAKGFNIGTGYGLGLTDLRPIPIPNEGKTMNRVLSFSIGYAF